MLHIRPDPGLKAQECNLRVSIQPLRLNVDQVMSGDSFIALTDASGKSSLKKKKKMSQNETSLSLYL